jgi:hypothetical protein
VCSPHRWISKNLPCLWSIYVKLYHSTPIIKFNGISRVIKALSCVFSCVAAINFGKVWSIVGMIIYVCFKRVFRYLESDHSTIFNFIIVNNR